MEYKFNDRMSPFNPEDEKDVEYVEFMEEVLNGIQFVKNLTNPNRAYAKDLERKDFEYAVLNDAGDPTGEWRTENKIDPDITNPHILEDMDYFREAALHFKKHGKYTLLTPNRHPHSEYAKFWREEKRRCLQGLVRPSDGEWIPGYYYHYLNYNQIEVAKEIQKGNENSDNIRGGRVKDFPAVWDGDYWYFHYVEKAEELGLFGCTLKTRGRGFEQPYSELVITPEGDKKVGDIKVGDSLIDKNGLPTKVIEIFEQGDKDVYEVTLKDGRKVKCGENHLWQVYNSKNKINVFKTKDLLVKNLKTNKSNKNKNSYNYHIPQCEAVQFSIKDLPVPPYTLGALLGDGSINDKGLRISSNDVEIIDKIKSENPTVNVKKDKWDKFRYIITSKEKGINDLKRNLKSLNLTNVSTYDKFIPEIYKTSCVTDRLELVKGLMDTDGTSSPNGTVRFTNTSEKLVDDLAYILRSLGIVCKKIKCNTEGKITKFSNGYKSIQKESWILNIVTDKNIFNLKRKSKNIRKRKYNLNKVAIIDIQKLNYKEKSRCFLVDNSEHLYLTKNFVVTHNSYKGGAKPARNFTLIKKSNSYMLAYDAAYLGGDGIWSKAMESLDWMAKHTPWARMRTKDSQAKFEIRGGYKRKGETATYGMQTLMNGIVTRDNEDKARGIRGKYACFEEAGKYPKLLDVWGIAKPSYKQGNVVYGYMEAFGTGGSEEANFQALENLFRKPATYNILGLPNVYDLNVSSEDEVAFFMPEYINRSGCMDENGNSDVIAALKLIYRDRKKAKANSNDPFAIVREKAEAPITPTESMMRKSGTIFPIHLLTELLTDIRVNESKFVAQNYVVDLELEGGKVKWKYNKDKSPIRKYPHDSNLKHGAVELFELPEKDKFGEINSERYIVGIDPYVVDGDAQSSSLGSVFVFDLFTDCIVAEYTGRPTFASDFFEICRRLCIMYNAKAGYENRDKGIFGHFRNKNSIHYLAPVPEYLMQKNIVKSTGMGNASLGIPPNTAVIAEGLRLQSEWLEEDSPNPIIQEIDGVQTPVYQKNYEKIKSIGYLEELVKWNPENNFDRVSAMNCVMIMRADRQARLESSKDTRIKRKSNDPFFKKIFRQSGDYSFKAIGG